MTFDANKQLYVVETDRNHIDVTLEQNSSCIGETSMSLLYLSVLTNENAPEIRFYVATSSGNIRHVAVLLLLQPKHLLFNDPAVVSSHCSERLLNSYH